MATIVNPSDSSLQATSPRLITVSLATNLLFAGNVTGTVNGVNAADITSSITNFNNSNDQNGAAITAPAVVTPATHTSNADGAVNVRFAWTWSGTESSIDGFIVYTLSRTSSAAYTFSDTAQADEVLTVLPASRRAHTLYGVPATNYYSFGVRAYRRVNTSVTSSGVIFSTLAQTTTNFPYRPSSVVNIDIGTGQLNGAGIGSYQNSNVVLSGSNGTISLTGGTGSATGVVMPGNRINSGNITTYMDSLAIGSAQIANTLQSTNWVDGGTTGWQINKTGNVTINQLTARGSISGATVNAGTFTDYVWPAVQTGATRLYGGHLGPSGLLVGNANDTTRAALQFDSSTGYFFVGKPTGQYITLSNTGTFTVAGDIVATGNIKDNAVSYNDFIQQFPNVVVAGQQNTTVQYWSAEAFCNFNVAPPKVPLIANVIAAVFGGATNVGVRFQRYHASTGWVTIADRDVSSAAGFTTSHIFTATDTSAPAGGNNYRIGLFGSFSNNYTVAYISLMVIGLQR